MEIGSSLTLNSFSDWQHYAFSFVNSGNDIVTRLYVNGALSQTKTTGSNIAEIRASRAYLTSIIDSLSDGNMSKDIEEKTDLGNLASVSAGENRYTIKRIVGHVMEMTNNRLNHIRDSIKNK